MSQLDEESNFRQRLWGAAVFIAIMVIVLPLLLDGAGSESQFRRVEKLRQEPPSIVDADGNRHVQQIPEMRSVTNPGLASPGIASNDQSLTDTGETSARFTPDIRIGEDDPPDYMKAEQEIRAELEQSRSRAALTAWVVQAGSFNDQENAIAVRDRLRRGGFASFVRDRESDTEPYRVLVGPMISEQSAAAAQGRVMQLLGRDAMVLSYP
jgi:DedD protein